MEPVISAASEVVRCSDSSSGCRPGLRVHPCEPALLGCENDRTCYETSFRNKPFCLTRRRLTGAINTKGPNSPFCTVNHDRNKANFPWTSYSSETLIHATPSRCNTLQDCPRRNNYSLVIAIVTHKASESYYEDTCMWKCACVPWVTHVFACTCICVHDTSPVATGDSDPTIMPENFLCKRTRLESLIQKEKDNEVSVPSNINVLYVTTGLSTLLLSLAFRRASPPKLSSRCLLINFTKSNFPINY